MSEEKDKLITKLTLLLAEGEKEKLRCFSEMSLSNDRVLKEAGLAGIWGVAGDVWHQQRAATIADVIHDCCGVRTIPDDLK